MPYQDDLLSESTELARPPLRQSRHIRLIRPEKIGPAFWTVTGLISLSVNIILLISLIILGRELLTVKSLVQRQLLGGLYDNFVKMDQAHIRTSIPVATQVPAKFDLPLNTTTTVTLTEDTVIHQAVIYDLDAGNLRISQATMNIILPAGSQLPVQLDLVVPVDQQIPVNLVVDVDIPLEQTELHGPFTGLQTVVKPYYMLLDEAPNSWQEILCGPEPSEFCLKTIK